MRFILIYLSPNGTTEKTTMVLKNNIEEDGHTVELINLGRGEHRENFGPILATIDAADLVGFGAPAYHMEMLDPMKRFFLALQSAKRNYQFKAFLYLNYGGITSGKAFSNAALLLESIGIPVIGAMKVTAPHFHHPDPFPTQTAEAFIGSFYEALRAKDFATISADRQKELFALRKKRVKVLYPLVHVIGKKRELPITINPDTCRSCKKCVQECPVGAISLNDAATIDPDRCIHCYHCTVACRLGAVTAPVQQLDAMIRLNKHIVGMENLADEIYC
ncbi:4Fe-4S dicluster domain-containing protein [Acetobacterium fimetarium]|uniref:Ferredoxin n=1 Tax=Acetobacterium fimetarium TaxID=52691 RepID=A0ABR6WTK4_9FIRM|nr:4Fe-4S binding protein [Acetobacterium fimetarium]MBC3803947.1 4Fe-4S dicluster domain-containing protein [Acetobacterium fimetarium]